MNKIVRENGKYVLICENGEKMACTRWFENKTQKWHVKLPKNNPSGREYVREDKIVGDYYEFPTKTEHRSGLSYANDWKARMTNEERQTYEQCVLWLEQIKTTCLARAPKELTEEEKLEREIAKLQSKLNKLRG